MAAQPIASNPMRPLVLKACSPLVLLAAVVSGCSQEPSLLRVACDGPNTVHRDVVFDRHIGQLYQLDLVRKVYIPQVVNRFTVKTQGVIKDNNLVIQTRVGEWQTVDGKRSLKSLEPPVGSDFTVNVTTLGSTQTTLTGARSVPGLSRSPEQGQCKSVALASPWVEQRTLRRLPSGS